MDYGRVLRRAWDITWQWKVLWILGFLASLGGGFGGGNTGFSGNSGSSQGINFPPEIGGLIILLLCVLFIIAIAVWVVSVMARGGLIAGVVQVEDEGRTAFGGAWRVGRSRFWTLFGISVLSAIPIIILVVIGIGILIATLAGAGAFSGSSSGGGEAAAILGVLGCLLPLICVIIILAVILDQIRLYAERAAILEGLNWTEAFKRGWQVLRTNLGPTIVYWLIFFVIGLVIGAIIFAGALALALPFLAFFQNGQPGMFSWAFIACGGLIGFILFALIGSVVQTFTSATWTLVYRELTGKALPPAPAPVPAV